MTSKATVPVYSSSARTATPTAVTLGTQRARGLIVIIDVTAATATPSVVPTIDGVDPLSSNSYNILTGAAITAVGTVALRIEPSITAVSNLAAGDVFPKDVVITMTHGDADSITYTVNAIRIED